MASVLLIPVGYQFLSNSGAPLAGGSLYTYAAGTTSLQTTWSDDALSVANPNPIPLNSAGRCSVSGVEVNVYPSAVSYKLVLVDNGGTTIWTHDNIDPASAFNAGLTFPATVGGTTSSGGVPFFSTATQLSSSGALTSGYTVVGGGPGSSPTAVATGAPVVVALTDGATPALDASTGTVFTLSAAGDRTIAVPSNPTSGQKIIIRHFASGGARTLSLNTGAGGFRFGSDIAALTQTVSGKYDYIGCVYNAAASFWDVVGYIKGF